MIPKVKVHIREPGNGLMSGKINLADGEGRIDVALLAARSSSYKEFHGIKKATAVAAAGTIIIGGAWKLFRYLSKARDGRGAVADGKSA